jgi:hypothetical protein
MSALIQMKYTTITDKSVFYPTHLVGYVSSTQKQLRECFGSPMKFSQHDSDGKVTTEWLIEFEDGVIATIYDWKRYEEGSPALNEVYEWHIGGLGNQSEATSHVLNALAQEVSA